MSIAKEDIKPGWYWVLDRKDGKLSIVCVETFEIEIDALAFEVAVRGDIAQLERLTTYLKRFAVNIVSAPQIAALPMRAISTVKASVAETGVISYIPGE